MDQLIGRIGAVGCAICGMRKQIILSVDYLGQKQKVSQVLITTFCNHCGAVGIYPLFEGEEPTEKEEPDISKEALKRLKEQKKTKEK